MHKELRVLILSLYCGVLLAQALAANPDRKSSPALDPAWTELNSSMNKMHAAMASVKPSGSSDVDFVKLMLPHHRAAVDMAETQLLYGKDPQARRLAQEIVTEQQSEIQLMELWLKQHQTSSTSTK